MSDSLSTVADLVLDGDADTTAYQLERQLTRSDAPYSVRTDERSLLHFAAYARSPATAAVLLRYGADVNERDLITGQTPLHAALFAGCAELVALLLQHGADASIRDDYGASVHDWARLLSLLPRATRPPSSSAPSRSSSASLASTMSTARSPTSPTCSS
jgi:ankyrin repeat protein